MLIKLIKKLLAYKKMTLCAATTDKDKEAVYRFRYEIYIKEMGITALNTNHNLQMITDDLDKDPHVTTLALRDKKHEIVGTVRYGIWDIQTAPKNVIANYGLEPLLQHKDICIVESGTTMLDKKYRGRLWLLVFPLWIFETFSKNKKIPDLIVGNALPSLIPRYLRLGFNLLATRHICFPDGIRITLAWCPYDKGAIKKKGLAYYYFMSHLLDFKKIAAAKRDHFSIIENFLNSNDKKALMVKATDKHSFTTDYVKMFDVQERELIADVFKIEELKHFASMLIKVYPNQIIIGKNVRDADLFYVIQGEFAVENDGVILSKIQSGSFFGEFAIFIEPHLRTANVIALTPGIILCLRTFTAFTRLRNSKDPINRLLYLISVNLAKKLLNQKKDI